MGLAVRVVILSPFLAERSALEDLLRGDGHEVASASDRDSGLALARFVQPDAVIADAQLAGPDDTTLVGELGRLAAAPRTILLCSRSQRCPERSGVVCMVKPIDLRRLYDHLIGAAIAEARAG